MVSSKDLYMHFSRINGTRAFTLIELLVVILIIAILIAVAAPSFLKQQDKARDSATKQSLTISRKEVKAVYVSAEDNKLPLEAALVADLNSSEPQYEYVAGAGNATKENTSVVREGDDSASMCLQSESETFFCLLTNETAGMTLFSDNSNNVAFAASTDVRRSTGPTEAAARQALTGTGSTANTTLGGKAGWLSPVAGTPTTPTTPPATTSPVPNMASSAALTAGGTNDVVFSGKPFAKVVLTGQSTGQFASIVDFTATADAQGVARFNTSSMTSISAPGASITFNLSVTQQARAGDVASGALLTVSAPLTTSITISVPGTAVNVAAKNAEAKEYLREYVNAVSLYSLNHGYLPRSSAPSPGFNLYGSEIDLPAWQNLKSGYTAVCLYRNCDGNYFNSESLSPVSNEAIGAAPSLRVALGDVREMDVDSNSGTPSNGYINLPICVNSVGGDQFYCAEVRGSHYEHYWDLYQRPAGTTVDYRTYLGGTNNKQLVESAWVDYMPH